MSHRNFDRSSGDPGSSPSRTIPYSLIAMLAGLVLLLSIYPLFHKAIVWQDSLFEILKELAMVLISVFGISYLYENLSAREHFSRFAEILQEFVERGESVTAKCEALGIREIHESRGQYLQKHPFSEELTRLHHGDTIRITGRSLINTIRDWGQFKPMLEAGATLELCMCDPKHSFVTLAKVSRYVQQETEAAYDQFFDGLVAWLKTDGANIKGRVELKLHTVDLMDSLIEIKTQDRHLAILDLNFGKDREQRYVLYADAHKSLGINLCERNDAIWSISTTKYDSKDPAAKS